MPDTPFIHWTKQSGDRFRTKLHPLMLSEQGYAIARKEGDRRNRKMHTQYVIFDRSYVLAILKNQFDALGVDIDDANELVNEAMIDLQTERDNQNVAN